MSDFANNQSNGGDFGGAALRVSPVVDRERILRETRSAIKGIAIGIIGIPNSGKTSFLYSLKMGAASHAKGTRAWILGSNGVGFAGLTGQKGADQRATESSRFEISDYAEIKRVLLSGTSIGRSRMLCMPEVSGELTKMISEGKIQQGYEDKCERYCSYLGESDVLLCLAGLDSGASTSGGSLQPDASLSEAMTVFEVMIGETLKRRKRRSPIAVSILITKVDLLREHEALDLVSLSPNQSALAALLEKGGRDWMREMIFGNDGERVRFRVTALIAAQKSRGDIELQEAIAADFLKCHAPTAAKLLSKLCKLPRVAVRFCLSAPYGSKFEKGGVGTLPSPEQLKPSMVYEPLEDALERSWAANAGMRLRRNLLVLSCVVIALIALGPVWLWQLERSFDSVPPASGWKAMESAKDAIESHLLHRMELSVSEKARHTHARRLIELRSRMQDQGTDATDVENMILELDPDAVVGAGPNATRLDVIRSNRGWADLQSALDSEVAVGSDSKTSHMSLTDAGVNELLKWLANRHPENVPLKGWSRLGKDLVEIKGAISAPPSGKVEIKYPSERRQELTNAVDRVIVLAELCEKLKSSPASDEYAQLQLKAVTVGEPKLVAQLDGFASDLLDKNWSSLEASRGQTEDDPKLAEALDAAMKADAANPGFHDRVRQRASVLFDAWLEKVGVTVSSKVARPTESPTAVEYLRGVRRTIEKVRGSRQAFLLAGSGDDLSEILALSIRRSDRIDELGKRDGGHVQPLSDALRLEIERDFVVGVASRVAWNHLDPAVAGAKPALDLGSLFKVQSNKLDETLQLRLQELVKDKTFDSKAVDIEFALADKLALPKGTLKPSLPCLTAASELRKLCLKQRPSASDLSAFKEVMGVLVASKSSFEVAGRDAISAGVAKADSIGELLPLALETIETAKALDEPDKRRWAEMFVAEARWSAFSGEQLVKTSATLRKMGAKSDAFLPLMLAEVCATACSIGNTPAGREAALNAIGVVLVDAKQNGGAQDQLILGCIGELLRSARQEIRDSKSGKELFDVANSGLACVALKSIDAALRNGKVPLNAVSEALADIAAYTATVRDWNLVKIITPGGAEPFWISPAEWNTNDISRVWQNPVGKVEVDGLSKKSTGFEVKDGNLQMRPRQNAGRPDAELEESLRLPSQDAAKWLVESVGLRLPTGRELDIARGMSADLKSDTRTCAATAAVVFNLELGVREWISDEPKVWGKSKANPNDKAARAAPIDGAKDVGIRPALSGVPKKLDQIAPK